MRSSRHKRNVSNANMPEVNVRVVPFTTTKERTEFFKNLAISSEFDMRQRGILEYYGKDLIAYKLEDPKNENRNEFLRVLAEYMTTRLEDNCPPSWKACHSPFWEELIFAFIPHNLQINPNQNEAETYLNELKMFVKWLDKRAQTNWYPIVTNYVKAAVSDLIICESILHAIFLDHYPKLFQDDWNPFKDIENLDNEFEQCADQVNSCFVVTKLIDDLIELTEYKTDRMYQLKGLPSELMKLGLIMNGSIGRKRNDLYYKWFHTGGIYPPKARKCFNF
ncbi:hypothetical protein [Bacillus sp. MRMR6]|uniref:hypothetical protein n=1 Tax=Bacillus sp. MRMR6 TaxID=1928617 RepID=UPI000952C4C9|nr:hypothetical protein [Bacillus sp. MRMR6]OLS39241.1 hypothetical protein BTR25_12595 [Bacillus sp. MRMR6]